MTKRRMMLVCAALAVAGLVLVTARQAPAETKIGEPAPSLTIDTFVKGAEVKGFEKGKTYVVEFWATWCGPCRTSIPHLTELQKKFKEKVVFVGVTDEDADTVRPFVENMGDKMDYVVAVDKKESTGNAYMKALGVNGIPHAFVVNGDGKLVWHGHPMDKLEEVLDKVVAGKFDLEEAKKVAEQQVADAKAMEKVLEQGDNYFQVAIAGDKPDAGKLKEMADKVLEAAKESPKGANDVAWAILTHPRLKHRDHELAQKLATIAVEATGGKDPGVLDTYARALHDGGKLAEAVEQQKKAVELAREGTSKTQMQKTLEKYEADAKEKGEK